MIEIRGIKKSFGKLEALRGFDLSIEKGKITAVLGPNGSGKTTLIKSILGLVVPGGGEILFYDKLVYHEWQYRTDIGYLPQIARFPENLKVREVLRLIEDIRNIRGNYLELINQFDLKHSLNKKLRNLSGGTRQKVNIVLTFMFDCPLYILDEPTAGLDPIALIRLKDMIIKMNKKGKTFLITTHIMSLVEEFADELVFLLEGKIYFRGTCKEMLKSEKEESQKENAEDS
jgi:Cu-processing system ATP-binding protein